MSNEETPKEEKCGNDCGCHGSQPATTSQIAVPEGLTPYIAGPSTDLKAKLEKLFANARNKPEEKDTISTGSEIKVEDFKDTDIDGLRVTTAVKSELKSEDIKRIMGEAEEMDCSDEDEDGNPVELVIDDGGPAKSDYKPGMLRDLKAKFYPNDSAGIDAQARLDSGESDAEEEVPRVSQEVIERETLRLNALSKWAEEIESGLPHEFGILECVTLENGTRIYVPKDFDFNRGRHGPHTVADDLAFATKKLQKIMNATNYTSDKALGARQLRTELLRKQIMNQREAVEREKQRVAKLTEDTITISPIENPSLLRRAIRAVRRTCKRIVVWWRL